MNSSPTNNIILKTARLKLSEFTLADSAFILELLNTEGWIKYIGDRNVKTTEQAETYLRNGPLESYRIHGHGLGRVSLAENDQVIGMCGLLKREDLDFPDLGFAFLPAFEKQGYAQEVASATIRHGFDKLGLKKILAITLPDNLSSINLLKKTGFEYQSTFISKNTQEELLLFSISKPVI